jgi:tetratricopeptide (TPR) repeat protein
MRTIVVLLLVVASGAFAQTTPSDDPQALFTLGLTRHNAGDLRGAIEAYTSALAAGFPVVPRAQYRIAAAQAQLGDKEKALGALRAAVDAGFSQVDLLWQENDFIPIRTDPRFAEIAATARKNQHPCAASAEYRQFDYWLGEWDVEIGGQKAARSSIQLIVDDCVIFENYAMLNGSYSGKSFSMWAAASKKWEQRYVDSGGAFHEWSGAMDGDTMRFFWTHDRGAQKVLSRMSYLKEGPDRVRQVIEDSRDDGKTWIKTFDGLYSRRK